MARTKHRIVWAPGWKCATCGLDLDERVIWQNGGRAIRFLAHARPNGPRGPNLAD